MLTKQWIMIGAMSGFLSVVFGAFGGHVLKEMLSPKALSIYLIAVQYQMYHSIALIGLGLWAAQNLGTNTFFCGLAFTFGVVVFSGSLYTLALTDVKWIGMLTPIGGAAFLAGWIGFAFLAWKV